MKKYEVSMYAVTPYIIFVEAENGEEATAKATELFNDGQGMPLTLETTIEYSRVKEMRNAEI
jgi:hypothetical protein